MEMPPDERESVQPPALRVFSHGTRVGIAALVNIGPYIQIARPSHWFKNVFMAPGILLVYFFDPGHWHPAQVVTILLGFVCACLVSSSNYVLNEILDAPKDTFHPEKQFRPIPSGEASVPLAYAEWLILAFAGLGIGVWISPMLGLSALALWVMGALYNVPPIRLKDRAYSDVLSESVNNPIRLAIGWYATGHGSAPTLSVVVAYWMFGSFLMAMKRFAEYRTINDPDLAAKYRKSFGYYNEERLVESMFFYGALFGMLSGVFIARYHVELVLAAPVVAYAMAYYMHLGFKPDSPVQNPELLYRQKKLMVIVLLAFTTCTILLFTDVPAFTNWFNPWLTPPS